MSSARSSGKRGLREVLEVGVALDDDVRTLADWLKTTELQLKLVTRDTLARHSLIAPSRHAPPRANGSLSRRLQPPLADQRAACLRAPRAPSHTPTRRTSKKTPCPKPRPRALVSASATERDRERGRARARER